MKYVFSTYWNNKHYKPSSDYLTIALVVLAVILIVPGMDGGLV